MTPCDTCTERAQRIADLEAEVALLRNDIRKLADRVAICSELLGKRAEKRPITERNLP